MVYSIFFLLLTCLVWHVHSASWRVRVVEDADPRGSWKWDVNELEFYLGRLCEQGTKSKYTLQYLSSGNHGGDPKNSWGPHQAFNGRTRGAWGGRVLPDPVYQNLRFIGMAGLPAEIRCIRIWQEGAAKIAVERFVDASSRWQVFTECDITKHTWSSVTLPDTPLEQWCSENEHVVNHKCQPCPDGLTRPAGDSTLLKDTACDVLSVHSFDVGTNLATHAPWTWFLNGGLQAKPLKARDMHAAACQDKMLVSWTSQSRMPLNFQKQWGSEGDTFGHVTMFSVSPVGVTMISSFKLGMCTEMGGVTASEDCSVFAALCVSRKPPSAFANFQNDVVADATADDRGRAPFGWYEESYKDGKREVFHMYLLEWHHGQISASPDASALVNKAIGGWRYGHWALSLNSANNIYSINLKTTLYGGGVYHEGDVHLSIRRAAGKFLRAKDFEDGWACARGHTLWNTLTYNQAKDQWGRWCWTDTSPYTTWFKVVKNGEALVAYQNPHGGKDKKYGNNGGPSDLVSFGTKGWIGVSTGPISEQSDATRVGLVHLTSPNINPSIAWFDAKVENGNGAGWAKLSHIGHDSSQGADRFLLGWAEYGSFREEDLKRRKFKLAEVDHTGKLLKAPIQVDNAGWGEKTDWVFIPSNGCVAWPHVWNGLSDHGKGGYGSWAEDAAFDDFFSRQLRIVLHCPDSKAATTTSVAQTTTTSTARPVNSLTITTTMPTAAVVMLREAGGKGCFKSKGGRQLLQMGATSDCARFIVSGTQFRAMSVPGQCLDYFLGRGWALWPCHGRHNQQLQRQGLKWCVASNCVESSDPAPLTSTTTTTAPLVGALRSGDRIFIKTRSGIGNHIEVEGSLAQARWESQGTWQAMVIEKQSGGTIQSGDTIYLKAHNDKYIDVLGTNVKARFNDRGTWQAITIEKKSAGRDIHPNDLVCLKAHTGKHLDVEHQLVQARWDACDDWQTMLLQKETDSAIFSGDLIHLSAHTGNRIDVEGDEVHARWIEKGRCQTFAIENYGGRAIFSGDKVFLTAHTGKMLDIQGVDVKARWHDRGTWQTLTIEKKESGAVLPGDSIFLRAHTGNMVEVDGVGVHAQWNERGT